jgi:uncharacterized membrane protein YqiK
MTTGVLVIFGALLIFLVLLVLFRTIMRAYVKTPANRAFVRTGGFSPFGARAPSPPRVVMNGGAWVFRTFHEITWVDLGTMAIEIERTENNALVTIDPQYADIKAIFYIKVNPTIDGIVDAARTIGSKQVDAEAVKQLVDAKLDGALRDVAASFTLMSLHQEREKFIQEVQNRLKTDLEENGLVLEAVSILTLKAARQGSFGVDDVFGAQVARANAQVIQQALKERNDIERQAEVAIKQRDTDTAKLRLNLDRELALATATQDREVRTVQAEEKAQAERREYEELQKSEAARVAKERAVALMELERDQQIGIQTERKAQEVMATEVARRQAIELAEQQRQIVVTQEQQKREAAEKERLLVSAEREGAAQAVVTVQATQEAQREAKIRVIEAEREAQKAMIDQKNRIELDALRKQREAEAQAKAMKEIANAEAEAALKQAETLRTAAKAETEAQKLRADASKATSSSAGLAEADVMQAKAAAAMREAEAIKAKGIAEAQANKAKAEALAAYDGVAQRVEVIRLQLDAQVRIETARAQALGQAMSSMNIKLIGDPNAAASLLKMMTLVEGTGDILRTAPQPVREIAQQLLNKVTGDSESTSLVDSSGDGQKSDLSLPELAKTLPELIALIEKRLIVDKMKDKTVGEVLAILAEKAPEAEQAMVKKAQASFAALPVLNDLPFEELYLRVVSK